MQVSTALITAAGSGTRFFPVTKSIQKEMLPILNRPVIDYLVDQCIDAGIRRIILVTQERSSLLSHYYSEDVSIYEALRRLGTEKKYDAIRDLHTKAEFIIVQQLREEGYGTALPIKAAKEHLKQEEAFLYLTGDDIVEAENNPIRSLLKTAERSGKAVISGRVVTDEQVSRYGIIDYMDVQGEYILTKFVEKPQPHEVTSRLGNVSKYVLPSRIIDLIENLQANEKTGEYYLTDALIELSKTEQIAVHPFEATYLDCGNVSGWLRANLWMAKKDPALWKEITEAFEELR